ncbi:hypothetical protein SUDANB174_06156 [Streptomyces sp. enrichment culture]
MTPRPADEARRALREARGRGGSPGADGDRGAAAPPRSASRPSAPVEDREGAAPGRKPGESTPSPLSPPSPLSRPSRPGDIARAALRSARTARQSEAPGPADLPDAPSEAPYGPDEPAAADVCDVADVRDGSDVRDAADVSDVSDVPPGPQGPAAPAGSATLGAGGGLRAPAAATGPGDPTGAGDPGSMEEQAASGERPARPDDTAEADGSGGPEGSDRPGTPGASGSLDGSGSPGRAGDRGVPDGASPTGSVGARAARPADVAREALRAARRQAKADAASGGGPANGAPHARRSARSAGRQRRAAGPGTADARARAVRDFAAGAFRLPPEADRAEETPPAGEPADGSAADGRAAALPEPDPSPSADHTTATADAARATGSVSPEAGEDAPPDPSLDADRAAGAASASSGSRAVAQPGLGTSLDAARAAGSASASSGSRAVVPPDVDSSPGVARAAGSAPDSSPRARAAAHPEPDPSPGADHVVDRAAGFPADRYPPAGSPPTASRAGHALPPGGPGGGDKWAPPPQQPSGTAGGRGSSAAPPARPRAPRSMAAPGRDGDLRRTFPALPPRDAHDEGFAGTWWGNAWVTALEEGALDAARLERGRGYAERGCVDAITVTPGLVLAYVQGSRARPYRVQVRLRTLGDADWDRFLDAAVERPGHIAALLDKELPHSLADLADQGVPLLPGPGDLTPRCSCPDSGHPCKHAAALCYQTARLLDADPFVLLLLRGRGERALLDALSRRNAAREARAAQDRGPAPLPGVRAAEALAPRALPPLPAPLPAPPHPEQPPAYPAAPGGPDPFGLDQLATDAAARAHALLTTGRDPVGGLTLWQDAVRLAAARPGSGLTAGTRALYASLASAAGRDTAELARAVAAWRQGGPEGLDVLEEAWDPPAGRFDRARPLLLAADLPAFRPWRNRLTHPRGHVQLRLGRAGLWYAYESEPGREDWWPRGTPDLDPVGALTGLGTRVDL